MTLPRRGRSTVAAGVALALGAAIAFWPVVTGVRSFFHFDLRYEIVPLWHVTQRAILSGDSPFWIDGENPAIPPFCYRKSRSSTP